jgi:hypothetical protein
VISSLCEAYGCSSSTEATCTDLSSLVDARTCDCPDGNDIRGGPFRDIITLYGAETFTGCISSIDDASARADEVYAYPQNLENFIEDILDISVATITREGETTVVVTFTLSLTTADAIALALSELSDLWDVDFEVRSVGNDVYDVVLDYQNDQVVDASNQMLVSLALTAPLLLSRLF